MARFVVNLDLRKKYDKSLLAYLNDMEVLESIVKPHMEKHLEDITAGHIYGFDIDRMFKHLGMAVDIYDEKEEHYKAVREEKLQLLALLLEKCEISYEALIDSCVSEWIASNTDLLTEKEKNRFKHLVI